MIDWARVATLHDDLGDEGFGEVLALFLGEMAAHVGQLGQHGTRGQGPDALPDTLPDALHALRGAASNLGLVQLCVLCAAAEAAARAGQGPDLAPIAASWEESRGALLDGLIARGQIRNCASVSSPVMSR